MTPSMTGSSALDGPAATFVLYTILGATYSASGYVSKVLNGDREIRGRKAAKTLLIGAVAGGIIGARGDEITPGAVEAIAAGLVPVVDKLLNNWLPPQWGGSASYGRGATSDDDGPTDAASATSDLGDRLSEIADDTTSQQTTPGTESVWSGAHSATDDSTDADTGGQTGSPASHSADEMGAPEYDIDDPEPSPSVGESRPPEQRVADRVEAVPPDYDGYQRLRSIAGHVPSINGNGTGAEIRVALKDYDDPHTVLDAFDAVAASESAEGRAEQDGESA